MPLRKIQENSLQGHCVRQMRRRSDDKERSQGADGAYYPGSACGAYLVLEIASLEIGIFARNEHEKSRTCDIL